MHNIRAWFGRLFDIRTGEWKRLLLLYAFAFLLNISVVWGQAASNALFLEKSGAKNLPLMFIADAILTAFSIIIYSAFVDRLSNTRLMIIISLGGSILLIATRIGLFYELPLAYPTLFLLERVWRALISIHSWTYIADFYDTRMAKRHFPLIGSGSRTSGILAGVLIVPIILLFQIENLVIAWIGALFASGCLAWVIPLLAPPASTEKKKASANAIKNYQEGFRFVLGSPFLRLMAVAALFSTLTIYLLEFEAQSFLEAHFRSSANELGMFYGKLETLSNLITLPIQMFFLSRVITWLGVGNANLIFPVLSSIAYFWIILFPSLPAASFARVDQTALRSVFRTPIDGLLFNAISPNMRGRARAFINGLLIPLGALLAGLLLLVVEQQWLPSSILIGPGLFITFVYVFLSLRLRSRYAHSMLSLLEADEMEVFRSSRAESSYMDPATLHLLEQRLEQAESNETTVILAEMLYDLQGQKALPLLYKTALRSDTEVYATILYMLDSDVFSHPLVRELCLGGIYNANPDVRRAATNILVKSPGMLQDTVLLDVLLEKRTDVDETIQATIIPMLIQTHQPKYEQPSQAILTAWLDNATNENHRLLGLQVLARTGDKRLLQKIEQYVQDPSPSVRCQVAELIGQLFLSTSQKEVQQRGMDILQTYLADEDDTVRLTVVNSLIHLKNEQSSTILFVALQDEQLNIRQLACQGIHPLPQKKLEQALDDKKSYLVESATFLLARANHHRARRLIPQLMEQLVIDVYTLCLHRKVILPLHSSESELLALSLQEQCTLVIQRVFWLLEAIRSKEQVQTLYHSLQSTNSTERANAKEALESITTPRLARLIAPLIENSSLDALVMIAQDSLHLSLPSLWHVVHSFWPQFKQNPQALSLSSRNLLLIQTKWLQALTMYTLAQELHASTLEADTHIVETFQTALQETYEMYQDKKEHLVYTTARRLLFQHDTSGQYNLIEEELPMLSRIEKVIFLKQVSFFERMTTEQLRVIASISEEKTFEAEEKIVSEGESGTTLYVIVSGRVAIQRQAKNRRKAIARLGVLRPKEYFGEMSLFDDEPTSADVVALERSCVLLMRRDPLIALIKRQPELGLEMLKVFSKRLRQANTQLSDKTESKPKELVDVYDKLWGDLEF